ncbi:putative recombination endonuclease, partial [Escherichia coli 5905]
LHEYLRKN